MNPGILPAGISTHNCLKAAAVRTGQTSLHHHNVLQSDYSSASITQRVGSGTADCFNGIRISQSDQHNDQLNNPEGLEAERISKDPPELRATLFILSRFGYFRCLKC